MGNMSDPNIPASSMSIPMSAGGMPVSTSSLNGMNGSGGPDPTMMDGGGMPEVSSVTLFGRRYFRPRS